MDITIEDDRFGPAADANWTRTAEPERRRWLARARRQYPELRRLDNFIERSARAWCYDPSLVRPPPEPGPPAGLNRPLVPQRRHR